MGDPCLLQATCILTVKLIPDSLLHAAHSGLIAPTCSVILHSVLVIRIKSVEGKLERTMFAEQHC